MVCIRVPRVGKHKQIPVFDTPKMLRGKKTPTDSAYRYAQLLQKMLKAKSSLNWRFKMTLLVLMVRSAVLHGHAVGEFLKGLAVQGDGHPSVCIKGKLHAIYHSGPPSILRRTVWIILIPAKRQQQSSSALLVLPKRTLLMQKMCNSAHTNITGFNCYCYPTNITLKLWLLMVQAGLCQRTASQILDTMMQGF